MTDRTAFSSAIMICLLVTVAGCGDGTEAPADPSTADQAMTTADGATSTTPAEGGPDTSWEKSESGTTKEAPQEEIEVSLETVDKSGYEAAIKAHKGEVVLVDFWGTWCGPCREGFPHTVEIAKKHKKDGLKVIAVAIEYDADLGPIGAKKFLQEMRAADTQNLISSSADIDESFEFFGITGEALPEYHLFDREGKRIKVFSSDDNEDPKKAFSHTDIESAVKEALGL